MNAEVPKVLECLRDDHYKLSPIARLKTEMGFSSAFQTLTSGVKPYWIGDFDVHYCRLFAGIVESWAPSLFA